jgi:hypothetical protein
MAVFKELKLHTSKEQTTKTTGATDLIFELGSQQVHPPLLLHHKYKRPSNIYYHKFSFDLMIKTSERASKSSWANEPGFEKH